MAAPCRHLSFRRYGPDKGISSCCPVKCGGRNSSVRAPGPPHWGGRGPLTPIRHISGAAIRDARSCRASGPVRRVMPAVSTVPCGRPGPPDRP
ncbi:hypothetical protein STVIR_1559 [Streptomyces viridochromogenes Tue57]|uniref:Uncharacterized protein n=1 Tax=Streptomyces viridochromogenes Tue57 TaxID=1160705 RepID=L8PN55_STRVR|nr:hypothetical protein STVIR_1559 [Streptomyces viridochromogenes Tue57]